MSNIRNSYKRRAQRTPVLELLQTEEDEQQQTDYEGGKIKNKNSKPKEEPVVPTLQLSPTNQSGLTPSGISVFKSPRDYIISALKKFGNNTSPNSSPITTPKNALVQKKRDIEPKFIEYTVIYWDKELKIEQKDTLIIPDRYRIIKVAGKGAYGLVGMFEVNIFNFNLFSVRNLIFF